jgi:UDP-N-acetylglucosamine transferase subunit ALG13
MNIRTFVTVGNATQPFNRLTEMIEAVVDELPRPILMQFGSSRPARLVDHSQRSLDKESFDQAICASDVIVMHAGAGSVLTALRFAKIPIVVPREARRAEHIDDHQKDFVSQLVEQKLVHVANNGEELREALETLRRESRVERERVPRESSLERCVGDALKRFIGDAPAD